MSEPVYVHSKCCMGHWELVFRDGIWGLECERCGQPVGSGVTVIGPEIPKGCVCDECKKQLKEGSKADNQRTFKMPTGACTLRQGRKGKRV